jgi:beta-glucosidase
MTTPTPTDSVPLYRDASKPVTERLADLLGRMTTIEKAAQLGSAWVFQLAAGTTLVDGAPALLEHGLGQVTRVSGASNVASADAARVANAIQRHLVEQTRLGIPAIIHEEVCAGLMARGATVFPQPIGLASTWDPSLVERMATIVRTEMRAIGAHQGLSPVLDVCRDPRWGRIEETFGEDPHLVAMMGNAFVRGLQGGALDEGVVATAKHFVGYGASQGGLNWAPAHIPTRELLEVYLHPFEAAVRTAGLRSVMNAYNELDGIPCGASHELLTGILRDEWGFDGYVVADYFSVRQLENYHHLAADAAEAAAVALAAGLDVELPMTDCYGAALVDAVDAGIVAIEILDRAVERVLRTKFELGLFECPFVDVDRAASVVGAPSAHQFARSLASQTIVLLRNDGTLPIEATTTSTIAVIGPNADNPRNLFGDYSYAAHVETLLEMRDTDNVFHVPIPDDLDLDADVVGERTVVLAIRAAFPTATVRTTPGCTVNGIDRDGFDDAVRLAVESDIAVMVMGDKAGLTVDATCGESRDRSSLDLPGVQEELLRAVLATGTPVILVLVAGRPCGSVHAHERCAAVVAAWLPGDEGAAAIADVLSGAVNPGGKLPVSFPRTAGHVPVYYRQKRSGGRSHWKGDYVDAAVSPLYPFGHGLSYTSFELTASLPSPTTIGHDGEVTVVVTVTNTGSRDGDEVVQLYTRDPRASVTRPVLELKAFARVSVGGGEHRTVTFTVHAGQLGFYDRQLRYVLEPGEIEVHIGTSVTDLDHAGTFTIVTINGALEVDKVFDAQVQITDSDGAPPRQESA